MTNKDLDEFRASVEHCEREGIPIGLDYLLRVADTIDSLRAQLDAVAKEQDEAVAKWERHTDPGIAHPLQPPDRIWVQWVPRVRGAMVHLQPPAILDGTRGYYVRSDGLPPHEHIDPPESSEMGRVARQRIAERDARIATLEAELTAIDAVLDEESQLARDKRAALGRAGTIRSIAGRWQEASDDEDAGRGRIAALEAALREAEARQDQACARLLMVGSELAGDPKLDPSADGDPRWTPTLAEAAAVNVRLAMALEQRNDALESLRWARARIAVLSSDRFIRETIRGIDKALAAQDGRGGREP